MAMAVQCVTVCFIFGKLKLIFWIYMCNQKNFQIKTIDFYTCRILDQNSTMNRNPHM